MKAKYILPLVIVISALLAQLTFAALPRYEIIDLGTLGGDWSIAYSINNNGRIIGLAYNSSGDWRATLFDQTGAGNNIDLGTLDSQRSEAYSINDMGQIVGGADIESTYLSHATLFDPTGNQNNIDFGTLSGDLESIAYSINNSGQIVGWSGYFPIWDHATLFDPNGSGNNIELGTLGGNKSEALSINDSGQIVGWAEPRCTTYPFCSFTYRATLFDASGNGGNINLGTLPGGWDHSRAHSINNSGQIVGIAFNGNAHIISAGRAVLFDANEIGKIVDLGTLGGDTSYAFCINDKGQIVGSSGGHAALFDPSGNGNNIDLNTLIDPNSGWILEEARSINEQGWIVGRGYYKPIGETHAILMTPVPPKVIYVDDDATGANDGTSWADAYNYLQDALATAWSGDEIRVAEGIYTPDSNLADPNGSGDRRATFQLINGVTLKGGYAGFGQPDPNARDIELYETILSGDLDVNDVEVNDPCDLLTEPTRADNSYHVVSSNNCDPNAVLDGVAITGGNANCCYEDDFGGGIYNDSGRPTISNCTFAGNAAFWDGGGMYNLYSSPIVTNCAFTGNSATEGGGGMYNDWSNPILANCIFTRNSAAYGGGIYNGVDSNEALTNCTFIGNSADKAGGGMFHSNANITIMTNCRFIGNSTNANNTRSHAGGLYAHEGSVMLTNCVFSGNSTVRQGGGISTDQSDLTLINCTFSGNSALDRGGPMYCEESSSLTLTNCIVWANSPVQITLRDSKASISYSDIQGSWSGKGNIDADPCFVEIGYWDANGVWVEGDYHLLPGSPCIDAGDPNYLEEPNEVDLDGKPRVIGGRIDMGAYEAPIFAEARILPRTINLASKGKWITCYIWLPEEYDVADIDPNSVFFEDEIQPEQFSVDEQAQLATARFSREEVQAILEVGEIELTITGQLTDGTIFEGTDTIKVTNKAGGKSAK